MRAGALVAILLLALSGCARIEKILYPPKRSGPATPARVPPSHAPSPAVAPPVPLTPQMSYEEERQLRENAQRKLDETDRLLRQIGGRSLPPKERETFLLAQSFLDQARKALAAHEYERAANLAAKARTLTDDLAASTR